MELKIGDKITKRNGVTLVVEKITALTYVCVYPNTQERATIRQVKAWSEIDRGNWEINEQI